MATMPQVAPPPPPSSGPPAEHIYPTLTPAQLGRIAAHGRRRRVEAGEVLVQAGEQTARLFVVVAGRRTGAGAEQPGAWWPSSSPMGCVLQQQSYSLR